MGLFIVMGIGSLGAFKKNLGMGIMDYLCLKFLGFLQVSSRQTDICSFDNLQAQQALFLNGWAIFGMGMPVPITSLFHTIYIIKSNPLGSQ